jgi:replicative DNA helicase
MAVTKPQQGPAVITDSLRVPPHSIEAEQALLGGLMLEASAWDAVADVLTAEDFYRADHRLIFNAAAAVAGANQPIDVLTLSEYLERHAQIEDAGGLAYLGTLARDTPSAANIRAYAEIVRERALLRRMIDVGTSIAAGAFNTDGRNARDLVDEAERRVFEIAEAGSRGRSGLVKVSNILSSVVDRIDHLYRNPNELRGVPTGYSALDQLTGGLQRGDLIIIAGRPSMGKTTLAVNIAENAALGHKIASAVFSMEMSAEQVTLRMISSLGRIDQSSLRTGRLAEEDWPRIDTAMTQLSQAPIFIDETPSLTPTELRARARRLKREHNLGLVVVDYLQLMQVPGTKENRATEISEISRGLKALARELNVPVVALSQLNRGVEQRVEKRPVMSDLRESGAIEQDSDVILLIYREEVYESATPRKGIADIIIAKQRNGPTGEIQLTFRGAYTRFDTYAPESYGEGIVR